MIRVFARRTKKSPTDENAYYGGPPLWRIETDEPVQISCTFTYDRSRAEMLRDTWEDAGYQTMLGGPAYGTTADGFFPGVFLKPGCVITSRGCNNECWFCSVPTKEGPIREIPITEGFDVCDSNLLQCSEKHIRAVFKMLGKQKQRATFTGGLEAALLKDWHIDLLVKLKPETVFLAYDTPDDYEPLREASKLLIPHVFSKESHKAQCYVLIGYPRDTMDKARKRLEQVLALGLTPFAMLYKDQDHGRSEFGWAKFQREFCRKAIIYGGL